MPRPVDSTRSSLILILVVVVSALLFLGSYAIKITGAPEILADSKAALLGVFFTSASTLLASVIVLIWSRISQGFTIRLTVSTECAHRTKNSEPKRISRLFLGDVYGASDEIRVQVFCKLPAHNRLVKYLLRDTLIYLRMGEWASRIVIASSENDVTNLVYSLPHIVRVLCPDLFNWEIEAGIIDARFTMSLGARPSGCRIILYPEVCFCAKSLFMLSRRDERVFRRVSLARNFALSRLIKVRCETPYEISVEN